MQTMWSGLSGKARAGLVAGLVAILALAVGLGVWAYRADYQVLFSDVSPRDAAAMTAELDKMKTPYELADGGTTILVPQEVVYKTRLALMGREVPLHGAVGFEVFNNADFGMTEFVQKVNYLRAIQGELTRTILSIEDIRSARVHLALPEQGLFKKAATKPKASVTVGMKPGRQLTPEQVTGIQRLVAASVPDIQSADVTVLDQQGVALTRPAGGAGETAPLSQLDGKRSTEDYLVKKVTQVLEQTFGAGEAVASVDVVLNMDHGKVTTEEVLPARGATDDQIPTGVVVRERSVTRSEGNGGAAAGNGNTSNESDYQVGRRVEQMAIEGGAVKRLTIAVVVKQALSAEQLDKLKEVVGLAAGFNAQRGDAIVVHTLDSLANGAIVPVAQAPVNASDTPAAQVEAGVPGRQADPESVQVVTWVLAGLLAASVIGFVGFAVIRRRTAPVKTLGNAEREAMLRDVRQWLAAPAEQAAEVRK